MFRWKIGTSDGIRSMNYLHMNFKLREIRMVLLWWITNLINLFLIYGCILSWTLPCIVPRGYTCHLNKFHCSEPCLLRHRDSDYDEHFNYGLENLESQLILFRGWIISILTEQRVFVGNIILRLWTSLLFPLVVFKTEIISTEQG